MTGGCKLRGRIGSERSGKCLVDHRWTLCTINPELFVRICFRFVSGQLLFRNFCCGDLKFKKYSTREAADWGSWTTNIIAAPAEAASSRRDLMIQCSTDFEGKRTSATFFVTLAEPKFRLPDLPLKIRELQHHAGN